MEDWFKVCGLLRKTELYNRVLCFIFCDSTLSFEIEIDAAENIYVPNLPQGYGVQWYLDGMEINGATTFDHQPEENGDYVAYIYDSLGCDFLTEPFVYYNDASIQELQTEWWCYPNPAQNQGSF